MRKKHNIYIEEDLMKWIADRAKLNRRKLNAQMEIELEVAQRVAKEDEHESRNKA